MNLIKRWIYLPVCIGIIILVFVLTSLLDIAISVLYIRFYTTAAFIVSFGVGGIFACFFSYFGAASYASYKNEFTRWSVIVLIWIIALLFIFLLSVLEGGEYKAAFISFGVTLALTTLLFIKDKAVF